MHCCTNPGVLNCLLGMCKKSNGVWQWKHTPFFFLFSLLYIRFILESHTNPGILNCFLDEWGSPYARKIMECDNGKKKHLFLILDLIIMHQIYLRNFVIAMDWKHNYVLPLQFLWVNWTNVGVNGLSVTVKRNRSQGEEEEETIKNHTVRR